MSTIANRIGIAYDRAVFFGLLVSHGVNLMDGTFWDNQITLLMACLLLNGIRWVFSGRICFDPRNHQPSRYAFAPSK